MTRHPMAAADAAWLRMDSPTNLMVVTAAQWYDRPLDRTRMIEVLKERMIDQFPRFSQRVVEDRGLWWEDLDDFQVEDRVHELSLPEPAGRTELEQAVSDQVAVPLPWDRPLWDLYLVDNYEGGRGAAIFRMHHAIADGFSLVRVLLSLTDDPTVEPVEIAPPRDTRGNWTGVVGDAVRGATALVTHPLALPRIVLGLVNPKNVIDLAQTAASGTTSLGKLLLLPTDHDTVLKGPLGHAKQTTWTEPISLADVKRAAKASEATVNDLLLTSVAGALRNYLSRRGSAVVDVRAIVPFNLRPLDKPLPSNLGNQFGLVYLPLPIKADSHPERLAQMKQRMDAIKKSADGVVAYGLLEVLGMAPEAVERLAIKIFTAKGTGVMTNVPGPRRPVTLAGARVIGTIGWAPTTGDLGLGVAIFSYAGEITVGFCVDKGLIPDVEKLRKDFVDELARMLAAPH